MAKTDKTTRAILVSHTHWDRAWYLPFESFRFRLVYLIDRVIELLQNDPDYRCFVLDGQTILIEDYLEIKPENDGVLRRLISDERLIIGPWYVLPDLFLVSGEAIIRNLQYGKEMCNRYGNGLNVGYVPDPFGHIAQLPQILNGFDLETFIFMRGMPETLAEKDTLLFHWRGQDEKSSVLSYYLKDGYYNAAALGYDTIQDRYDLSDPSEVKAKESLLETKNVLSKYHPRELLLLNNGVDHMPEQPEIPKLIRKLNSNGSDVHLTQGSFSDFMDEAAKLSVTESYRGNLTGNPDHPILLSVYSARVYLKQQNHRAQSLLEKIAEPFMLMSPRLGSDENRQRFLNFAWKTLLKNHPHDDICGCSADAVHEENEVRFHKVAELAEALFDQTLEQMVMTGFDLPISELPEGESAQMLIFNPHPTVLKNQKLEGTLHFKNPGGKEENFILQKKKLRGFSSNGDELEVLVTGSEAPVLRADYISHQWGRKYSVEFSCDLPPLGYEVITFVTVEEEALDVVPENVNQTIENDHSKLEVRGGQLHWEHKELGIAVENLIRFEYTGDEGDTYTFSPVDGSHIVAGSGDFQPEKSHIEKLAMTYTLEVPEKLESAKTISLNVLVNASLRNDGSVNLTIEYENRAENGRLRILLPTMIQTEESVADGHFTLYENDKKPLKDLADYPERYNSYPGELQYPTYFQGDFSYVRNGELKTWIANKGLHEYEIIDEQDDSYFAVTLHRAVGYLSVSNGRIRRPQAGPSIPTPGAQCKRELSAELCWGVADSGTGVLIKSAKTFSHPPFVRQLPEIKQAPRKGILPGQRSLIELDNPMVQISALHAADQRGDVILRLYNLSDKQQKVKLRVGFEAEFYCLSSLKEEWQKDSAQRLNNSSADLLIKSNQIITLRFRNETTD